MDVFGQYYIQQPNPYPASILGVIQKSKWGFKQMTTIMSKLEGPLSEITCPNMQGPLQARSKCSIIAKNGEVWIGYVDGHFVCCWGLIPPSFLLIKPTSDVALESVPPSIPLRSPLADPSKEIPWALRFHHSHCKTGNTAAHRWLRCSGRSSTSQNGDLRTFVINRSA